MVLCCVPKCNNRSDRKCPEGQTISYHSFPSDGNLRCRWLKLIKKGTWVPNRYSKICSAHFTEDCYEVKRAKKRQKRKRVLKESAVPTIFSDSEKALHNVASQSHLDQSGTKLSALPVLPEQAAFCSASQNLEKGSLTPEREKEVFILPKPSPATNTSTIFLVSDPLAPADGTLPASAFVNVVENGAKPSFQLPLSEDSSKYFVDSSSQCDENEEQADFDPSDYVYPVYMEPDSPENPTEMSPSHAAADSPEVVSSPPAKESAKISSPSCGNLQESCLIVPNPSKSLTATNDPEGGSEMECQESCRNCERLSQGYKLLLHELEAKNKLLDEKGRIITFLEKKLEVQRSLTEEKSRIPTLPGVSSEEVAEGPSQQLKEKERVINYLQLEIIRLRKELALPKDRWKKLAAQKIFAKSAETK